MQAQPLLREALHSQALSLHMGLHTGLVIVGQSAANPQWLYTAAADTITVARRLQQAAAPDTILMSAATWQLVQEEVDGEARGTIKADELSGAIPVYTVRSIARRRAGVTGRSTRPWRCFVGRERELAMLHARLERVLGGAGQVMGISGEPGLGKSRLLAEFRRSVLGKPLRYCEGHCLSYGQNTPYLPVLDLLRQLCGILDTDGPEAMTAKIAQHLQEGGIDPEAEAPALLHLLDVPVPPAQLSTRSPEERKGRVFAILRQLALHSSQQHPLLLVVENLHWIDATSEVWLASLVECLAAASILLVVTYRPGYGPPWLVQSVATQMALSRLLPEDSRTVVQSVLQTTRLSESLLQSIITRAAGNPFFLEELTWAVKEQSAHPGALGLPDTIQSVLAARIDHLPPVEKHLLQTAAVIGTEVPVPLLQAIAELPAEAVSQGLAHLQAAEFVYEAHRFPEHVYTFKHALTHEVAYSSLLQERRRVLHASIVAALERLAPERLAEQVDRLALHAFRGAVWDKAVTYGRQAGARAGDRAASRQAATNFEQALAALGHLPDIPDTRELAIDLRLDLTGPAALLNLSEHERALTLLREAEALARVHDDQARLARVLGLVSYMLRMRAEFAGAIAASQEALALATARGDLVLQADASFFLAVGYCSIGDYGQAAALFRRNVEALEPGMVSSHRQIASRTWLTFSLSQLGQFAEGRRQGEEALRRATAEGRGNHPLVATCLLGRLYLTQGDLEAAIRMLERSLALCRAADNWHTGRSAAAGLGYAYALAGRLAEGGRAPGGNA